MVAVAFRMQFVLQKSQESVDRGWEVVPCLGVTPPLLPCKGCVHSLSHGQRSSVQEEDHQRLSQRLLEVT